MDSETSFLGNEMAIIIKLYYGAIGGKLKDLNLDRYYGLVYYLGTCEKELTQQEIADKFKMDKTVLVRVLDHLAEKGYVKRVQSTNDRRASFIHLTDKAKEILPAIEKATNEVNGIAFNGMDKEQVSNFIHHLQNIRSNLFEGPAIDFQLNYK